MDEYIVFDGREFPGPDMSGVVVGRDAVIEASRCYWGAWTDYRLDAEELIDPGSSVVVVVRERGRGKGSDVPIERCGAAAVAGVSGSSNWRWIRKDGLTGQSNTL